MISLFWGLFPDKKFWKNLFSQKQWRSKDEGQIVNISTQYIIYSIQFTVFQERNFVVIQTKFNKHIVYSLINRVEASSHPCVLVQRQK